MKIKGRLLVMLVLVICLAMLISPALASAEEPEHIWVIDGYYVFSTAETVADFLLEYPSWDGFLMAAVDSNGEDSKLTGNYDGSNLYIFNCDIVYGISCDHSLKLYIGNLDLGTGKVWANVGGSSYYLYGGEKNTEVNEQASPYGLLAPTGAETSPYGPATEPSLSAAEIRFYGNDDDLYLEKLIITTDYLFADDALEITNCAIYAGKIENRMDCCGVSISGSYVEAGEIFGDYLNLVSSTVLVSGDVYSREDIYLDESFLRVEGTVTALGGIICGSDALIGSTINLLYGPWYSHMMPVVLSGLAAETEYDFSITGDDSGLELLFTATTDAYGELLIWLADSWATDDTVDIKCSDNGWITYDMVQDAPFGYGATIDLDVVERKATELTYTAADGFYVGPVDGEPIVSAEADNVYVGQRLLVYNKDFDTTAELAGSGYELLGDSNIVQNFAGYGDPPAQIIRITAENPQLEVSSQERVKHIWVADSEWDDTLWEYVCYYYFSAATNLWELEAELDSLGEAIYDVGTNSHETPLAGEYPGSNLYLFSNSGALYLGDLDLGTGSILGNGDGSSYYFYGDEDNPGTIAAKDIRFVGDSDDAYFYDLNIETGLLEVNDEVDFYNCRVTAEQLITKTECCGIDVWNGSIVEAEQVLCPYGVRVSEDSRLIVSGDMFVRGHIAIYDGGQIWLDGTVTALENCIVIGNNSALFNTRNAQPQPFDYEDAGIGFVRATLSGLVANTEYGFELHGADYTHSFTASTDADGEIVVWLAPAGSDISATATATSGGSALSSSISSLSSGDELDFGYKKPTPPKKGSSGATKPEPEPEPVEVFDDIAKHWAKDDILFMFGKGYMKGVSETSFGPDLPMTRGMTVTVLGRMEGINIADYATPSFDDTKAGFYYTPYVSWAAQSEIVAGYNAGSFGPDDLVTREQLVAILYRYAIFKGYDVTIGEDTNILSYPDAGEISGYAIPAMQWACGVGLISGRTDGSLDPLGDASRAEVAAMLHRFIELFDTAK